MESEDKWMFITTVRLIWRSQIEIASLHMENIRDVAADFQKLMATDCLKDQMRELTVLTLSGERYIIDMEEGPPLVGVWNVLKNFGARNRISAHKREQFRP